jgi:cytochrome b6-f complex iron-sulfur subunit
MNRDEFLKQLGVAAFVTCSGNLLFGCSSENEPGPSNVDFILDLSSSQYSALNTIGGSVSANGIIIARLSTSEFVALSRACTHEGTAINYRSGQKDFLCPNHGARFSTTGAVLQGPANSSLRKYSTELTGTNLRIFS